MSQPTNEAQQKIKAFTVLGDYLVVNAVFLLIYLFYGKYSVGFSLEMLEKCLTILNVCYTLCLFTFKVQLHYRIVTPEKIIGRIIASITFFIVLYVGLSALMRMALPYRLLPVLYVSLLVGVLVWRIAMRSIVKHFRKKGRNIVHSIIVGGGSNVAELYAKLTDDPTYGCRVMAVFNDEPIDNFPASARYLGKVDEVISYLREHTVDAVYCSLPSKRESEIVPIINYCENNLVQFYSVPNVRNYVHRRMQMLLLDGIPVLYIRNEPLQNLFNKIVKRAFDLVVSTIFLCTVYPFVYLIVGAIIKLTSPGPIYFKQERNGEDGKVFKCIKFRSMRVNKDSDKVQATENDPRKTRFGNFLRKSNIDELPQFINVWKGEMSIVGPRPHMLLHTEMYSQLINKYMVRHLAKPGITGWAQVTGFRGETKELAQMEGRVKKDIWYIENWSFLLDLRIIYLTVANIVRGDKQAY